MLTLLYLIPATLTNQFSPYDNKFDSIVKKEEKKKKKKVVICNTFFISTIQTIHNYLKVNDQTHLFMLSR